MGETMIGFLDGLGLGVDVGDPGNVFAQPDLTVVDGDLDEPLTVEHQVHDRLRLEDDSAVRGHVASCRLLHEHPHNTITPFPASIHEKLPIIKHLLHA